MRLRQNERSRMEDDGQELSPMVARPLGAAAAKCSGHTVWFE